MLESKAWRLSPWRRTPRDEPHAPALTLWQRRIQTLDNATLISFVRCVRERSWWSCGPRRFEVCETEDASLVMALEQGWFEFGRWRVLDAENWCVGRIVGVHLLDEQGSRLGSVWRHGPAARIIRDASGASCAWCDLSHDGTALIRFADDLPANPFLRMVLFGACLAQQPRP